MRRITVYIAAAVMTLGIIAGCGKGAATGADAEPATLMDTADDGSVTAHFDKTEKGTGAASGITIGEGEYLAIDTNLTEGKVRVRVVSGGSDIEAVPLEDSDNMATIDYVFSESGTTEYGMIEPGDYMVGVAVEEKASGTVRFYKMTMEGEAMADEAAVSESNDTTDTETSSASDETVGQGTLPAYEYPGPEQFYYVLYDYIIERFSPHYDKADVSIPLVNILDIDESDKSDIKVYGDFWLLNYNLSGTTLENVSGGSYPGCIHMVSSDSGYEVEYMELVGDGADYDPTARQIFGDRYDAFMKLESDTDTSEELRAQIIANYVAANDLNITEYKDYGWDPVTLPEQNIDSMYSKLD